MHFFVVFFSPLVKKRPKQKTTKTQEEEKNEQNKSK
jgi:hypothetical protein